MASKQLLLLAITTVAILSVISLFSSDVDDGLYDIQSNKCVGEIDADGFCVYHSTSVREDNRRPKTYGTKRGVNIWLLVVKGDEIRVISSRKTAESPVDVLTFPQPAMSSARSTVVKILEALGLPLENLEFVKSVRVGPVADYASLSTYIALVPFRLSSSSLFKALESKATATSGSQCQFVPLKQMLEKVRIAVASADGHKQDAAYSTAWVASDAPAVQSFLIPVRLPRCYYFMSR